MSCRIVWFMCVFTLILASDLSVFGAPAENAAKDYSLYTDINLGNATDADFPAICAGKDNIYIIHMQEEQNGSLQVVITEFNTTSDALQNFTVGYVSTENITEETNAPCISAHGSTIYAAWVEKDGIRLAKIIDGAVVAETFLSGVAEYYHTPTIACYGNSAALAFLCGNLTTTNIVFATTNTSAGFDIEFVDNLPVSANAQRRVEVGYDIYGNTHIFISNLTGIEHYYISTATNSSTWTHEFIGEWDAVVSEVNARFINNIVYLSFMYSYTTGGDKIVNAVACAGILSASGAISGTQTILLSSVRTLPNENVYYNERAYAASSGTRTMFFAWTERDGNGNTTTKIAKFIDGEIVSVNEIPAGDMRGFVVIWNIVHIIGISDGAMHYQQFGVFREPVELAVVSAEARNITLAWSTNYDEDFAWYEVHYSSICNFTPSQATLSVIIFDNEQTLYQIDNLSLGVTYYFLLVVKFTNNESVHSNYVSYTTPEPVGSIGACVYNVSFDAFEINWTKIDCTKYEVHIAENPEFVNETVIPFENDTASTKIDNLECATTYFVFVRAYGRYGDTTDSEVIPVLTRPEILGVYTNVDEIRITWKPIGKLFFEKLEIYASENNTALFDLEYRVTTVFDPAISDFSIKFEDVNTTYYFGIILYNTYWLSQQSNVVSNTTELPQLPEVCLTKYEILNASALRVYWKPIVYPYFAKLEIHLSLTENFTPNEKTLCDVYYTLGNDNYVFYGLTPEVKYYVKIVVVDVFGQRCESNTMVVCITSSTNGVQPEPQIPFYLYGSLLLVFFVVSVLSALYARQTRRTKK